MFLTYTVEQMREAERLAEAEFGIPLSTLMENAGKRLAHTALEMCPNGPVAVFCGKGNNGGDGYVCATHLLLRGVPLTVWGIDRQALTSDSLAGAAADAFEAAGGVVRPFTADIRPEAIRCDLVVDAVFGTGLRRPLTGLYAHAVEVINGSGAPVLSCDLPSGIDGDTGQIMGASVRANRTLMLGLAKPACRLPPGRECFGEPLLGDIGFPPELIRRLEMVNP